MEESFEKSEVHAALLSALEKKMAAIQAEIDSLKADLEGDSKSSSGDKHETTRAMTHLEQEKLTTQMNNWSEQIRVLKSINPEVKHNKISLGTLVSTDNGVFYFSTGYGKLEWPEVFCISPNAPLAKLFSGKNIGDSATFNGQQYLIKGLE